jgi:hypothetical protein
MRNRLKILLREALDKQINIGNLSLNYEEYKSKLNYIEKVAPDYEVDGKEYLDRYLSKLNDLYLNGGKLYRHLFLQTGEKINKNNLGPHWTYDFDTFTNIKDELMLYHDNIDNEYEAYVYAPPKTIDPKISFSYFMKYPEQKEIHITTEQQPKIKIIDIKEV